MFFVCGELLIFTGEKNLKQIVMASVACET